jgi:hypothetical protein
MKRRRLWGLQFRLASVLLLSLSGCGDPDPVDPDPTPDGGAMDTTAPTITESSQSATQLQGQGPVTFSVTARDEETPQLTFSWTASIGTLGTPSSTGTTSEVLWTAPPCLPPNTAVSITVTITNGGNLTVTRDFTLSAGNPCTTLTVKAGSLYSVALRSDGTVWAWGNNSSGQLGDGMEQVKPVPINTLLPWEP